MNILLPWFLLGFSKEEIAIELLGNILKVNAKNVALTQSNEADANNKNPQQANESKESIKVPNGIDQDSVSATLN